MASKSYSRLAAIPHTACTQIAHEETHCEGVDGLDGENVAGSISGTHSYLGSGQRMMLRLAELEMAAGVFGRTVDGCVSLHPSSRGASWAAKTLNAHFEPKFHAHKTRRHMT